MIVHKVTAEKRTTNRDLHGAYKKIYVGCAEFDIRYRDMMVNFSQRWGFYTKDGFDFLTHDRRGLGPDQWKPAVEEIIRKSNGVMMLVSDRTAADSDTAWEIDCALSNDVPIVGVDIRKNPHADVPGKLAGKMTKYGWEWFADFIDEL